MYPRTKLEATYDAETIHGMITSTIREDFPLPLQTHLDLMGEADFTSRDVLWKKGVFGIYSGMKPAEGDQSS